MENGKLFLIGEVAKMYHISMGTLRHYEQEGLLTPEYTDPGTGYRYYSVRQLEVLNTIRYLRVLGIPLAQIGEFLNGRDIDVIEEKLIRQQEIIRQKQHELDIISRKIDHRLEQIRDAASSKTDVITETVIPAGRIVWIRDSLKLNSYLDLELSIQQLSKGQKEPVVFLGKVGVGISMESLNKGAYDSYELVFLALDDEDEYEGAIDNIPEQRCVMIRFNGSHNDAPQYYEKLMGYIKAHNMQVNGFSREVTLIDYGITDDTDKFVTEIRIPVKILN